VATHKSAKKRARQTIVRTERNKTKKSLVRSTIKKIRLALKNKDKEAVTALLPKTQALLAKLAKVGVIKKENASRVTSRLTSQANKL